MEIEPLGVWPEHWDAVLAFMALGTQWNVGMAGPIGLRYEVIPIVLRMQGVRRQDWPHVFECIRVMEGEALRFFAERRAEKDN